MMNVDGVILGNFRCNSAGKDINRQWLNTDKTREPVVEAVKELIANIKERKKGSVRFVMDLHGHSKKLNSFTYGVDGKNPLSRIFPKIMDDVTDMFDFESCSFNFPKNKEGSARAILFQMLKIPLIYTVETSFYGFRDQRGKLQEFNCSSLKYYGGCLLEGIGNLFSMLRGERVNGKNLEDYKRETIYIDLDIDEESSESDEDRRETIPAISKRLSIISQPRKSLIRRISTLNESLNSKIESIVKNPQKSHQVKRKTKAKVEEIVKSEPNQMVPFKKRPAKSLSKRISMNNNLPRNLSNNNYYPEIKRKREKKCSPIKVSRIIKTDGEDNYTAPIKSFDFNEIPTGKLKKADDLKVRIVKRKLNAKLIPSNPVQLTEALNKSNDRPSKLKREIQEAFMKEQSKKELKERLRRELMKKESFTSRDNKTQFPSRPDSNYKLAIPRSRSKSPRIRIKGNICENILRFKNSFTRESVKAQISNIKTFGDPHKLFRNGN